MTTGIFEGAIWRPGPKWKAGYTVFGRTSEKHGVVDHSSEGRLKATLGVLDSWETKSWQFTNDDSGLYQHYPISDVCWHAGFEANKKFVGVESTGRKDEPLTERQYQHLLELHRWLWDRNVLTACELRVDLWEHGWLMPTDCPSGRIPWDRLIADLREWEEPMPPFTEEQEERIKAIIDWSGPGLEMMARMAVAASLQIALADVLRGEWDELRGNLRVVELEAQKWNRWEE